MKTPTPHRKKNQAPVAPAPGSNGEPGSVPRNLEAELLFDRQERANRAAIQIKKICAIEKVAVTVTGFALNEGRLLPQIQIVAI